MRHVSVRLMTSALVLVLLPGRSVNGTASQDVMLSVTFVAPQLALAH